MPDPTLDHPAVEAASKAWGDSAPTTTAMWAGMSEHRRDLVRARMAEALKDALPHLTADDLRGTPAGQALMAEAKREVAYGLECLATGYDLSCHWEAARSARAAAKSLLEAFPKEGNR